VAGHVVHPDAGNVPHHGQTLGKGKANQQGTDQARSLGGGDQVNIGKGEFCLGQGLVHHRPDGLDMGPGGQLRHNTAERGVDIELAADDVGQHPIRSSQDCRGRIITGTFYGKNMHGVCLAMCCNRW